MESCTILGQLGNAGPPTTSASRCRPTNCGSSCGEFATFSLKIFQDVVLNNTDYVKLITGDVRLSQHVG